MNIDRWNKQIDYVEDHLNLKYSAKLLCGANLEERVNKTYEKLSPEVMSSYYGQILKYRMDSKNVKTIGAKFPNIKDTTLNGANWVLSDFKGKYVLIDFWGSWCAPCIAEIPTLKKLENDCKNELEIIGIACNDNESRLRELINKKGITWNNIFERKSDQNNYSVRFGIQRFPT